MNLLKSFMENNLLVVLATLSFWVLGIATASIVPILLSGVLAFGRPFFQVMLQDRQQPARRTSLQTSAACAN